MGRKLSSVGLAACVAGLLSAGIATPPAYATPEVAGEAPVDHVTDPQSLVNDPRSDATRNDNAQNTPSLAASGSTVIATYNDGVNQPDFSPRVGYSVSADSGATWVDRGLLSSGGQWQVNGPASVAADLGQDRFYLAARGESSDGSNDSAILVFPADGSGEMGSPVAATETASGDDFVISPWIAVDNFPGPRRGTVYLAYSESFDGLRMVRSADGGATWSAPVALPTARRDWYHPRIIVTPDHCVHVAYFASAFSTPDQIKTLRSCDGGLTFGPEAVVATLLDKNYGSDDGDLFLSGGFETNSKPQIAVNAVTGALYVVYNDLVSAEDGDADVFFTSSTDGGSTWSPPTRVNADNGDHDQFGPVVAVTDDGTRLMVGYYDRRHDPLNLDTKRWGRIAAIDTGTDTVQLGNEFQLGSNFPPVKDTLIAEFNAFSDHETVIALGQEFLTAWTDNRDADQLSYFQSDIRSATIPTGLPTDVSLTVTAPQDVVPLGGTYSYTATVRNNSNRPADNVAVRSALPRATRYVSATVAGPGSCYRLGQDVSCGIGTLDPGASVAVTITAQALKSGLLQRKAIVATSSLERRRGDNAAARDGRVSAAPTTTERFDTGDLAIPIEGPSPTVVPLDIDAGVGTALDLDVAVRLNYGDVERLSLELVDPDGLTIPLSLDNGNSTAKNYGDGPNSCGGRFAVFDDGATRSIFDANAPFVKQRAYNPEGTLSDALGGPYDGTWQLLVTERGTARTGQVGCLELRIRHTT